MHRSPQPDLFPPPGVPSKALDEAVRMKLIQLLEDLLVECFQSTYDRDQEVTHE